MPISHALWTVGSAPNEVQASTLASEQLLEDMIVAEPRILSEEWMLIGRQEDTGRGGKVDLLAMAPDGSLVLAELKRDRTPREVVAQALDYASWVEDLEPEEIAAIYARFRPGQSLEADFQARFGQPLDEETVNKLSSSRRCRIIARCQHRAHHRLPQPPWCRNQRVVLPGLRARRAEAAEPGVADRPCGGAGASRRHRFRTAAGALEW